jgi:Lon protease-like protein
VLGRNHHRCHARCKSELHATPGSNNNTCNLFPDGQDEPATIILSVFPLQKSVRLPTDVLTLNLYEPRYLALSEYILSKSIPAFGAIYASDKAQLIKMGVGPIVPMLDVGDIGTLCHVQASEEGLVPSIDGTVMRRRIRLNALAIGRFRIEKVLHDGCGGGSSEEFAEGGPPPFLVVKASLVRDSNVLPLLSEEEAKQFQQLEEQVRLLATQQRKSQLLDAIKDDTSNSLSDEYSSSPVDDRDVAQTSNLMTANDVLELTESLGIKDQRQEILSFAAASTLRTLEQSANDMLSLLRMESTVERLEQVLEQRQRPNFWRF